MEDAEQGAAVEVPFGTRARRALLAFIEMLEELMEFNHDALVVRQLMPAQKELTRERTSLGLAAVAAEQLEGN